MDAVGIDVKLESWSKELDKPKEDLQKELDEIAKEKCNGDYDKAVRKLGMKYKRKIRMLKDMDDYKGTIVAISQARNTAEEGHELYVANVLGILDTQQPFRMTLWGKDAARNDIPEQVEVTFKTLKRLEDAKGLLLSGNEVEYYPTGEEEKRLVEFLDALKSYYTTLEGLEKYYEDNKGDRNNPIVVVKGRVYDKFNRPSKKGNYIVTLDEATEDIDLTNEGALTTVAIPERKMIDLEAGDDVIVIGDCWKPAQTYDRATREYIDTPARVQINAWNIEKTSENVIRISA